MLSTTTVIVVGGGVAGLTLANFLERLSISYVLLEAHNCVAPEVGASIGLHPNGFRLLDQIGLYEKIKAISVPADRMTTRTEDGRIVSSLRIHDEVKRRHGYEITFLERRAVLQLLYDNLKRKSTIHTSQCVVRIEHTKTGVQAYTKQGGTFAGQVLIGADGVHSTVRTEMWRIADLEQPGVLKAAEKTGQYSKPVRTHCLLLLRNAVRVRLYLRHVPPNGWHCSF